MSTKNNQLSVPNSDRRRVSERLLDIMAALHDYRETNPYRVLKTVVALCPSVIVVCVLRLT
jgi:hypothetical protein